MRRSQMKSSIHQQCQLKKRVTATMMLGHCSSLSTPKSYLLTQLTLPAPLASCDPLSHYKSRPSLVGRPKTCFKPLWRLKIRDTIWWAHSTIATLWKISAWRNNLARWMTIWNFLQIKNQWEECKIRTLTLAPHTLIINWTSMIHTNNWVWTKDYLPNSKRAP